MSQHLPPHPHFHAGRLPRHRQLAAGTQHAPVAYNVRNEARREREMGLNRLTPEQIRKAKACKTPEELLALAKEEGYTLSEEELQSVSGGGWGESPFSWDCDDYVDTCVTDNYYYN